MAGRVLIIEDDAKIRMLLKEYLEGNDFEVITLADGNNALDFINAESPDIVILDIMLPGKNGLEVLKEIRQNSSIPVVMLTAYMSEQTKTDSYIAGCNEYVLKPVYCEKLMFLLEKYLLQEKEITVL